MKNKCYSRCLALFVGIGSSLLANTVIFKSAHADVFVITNASVISESLSRDDIKKIFLGTKTNWNDNQEIKFALIKESNVHKEFLTKFINKSPAQYKTYWESQIFTGKDVKPTAFSTEAALIKYVSETKGAIGYTSTIVKTEDIKLIKIREN